MIEGKIRAFTIPKELTCPPIHNKVVVTSPIGLKAPPAFAAITTIPVNTILISPFGINFLKSVTIMIAVAKLSSKAERTKVIKATIHNNLNTDVVLILLVITVKPLCMSINSTIVIAPIKNINKPEISPKYSINLSVTKC